MCWEHFPEKKQTSLMSEVYCMDCFNIPHMSAVHFHAL